MCNKHATRTRSRNIFPYSSAFVCATHPRSAIVQFPIDIVLFSMNPIKILVSLSLISCAAAFAPISCAKSKNVQLNKSMTSSLRAKLEAILFDCDGK